MNDFFTPVFNTESLTLETIALRIVLAIVLGGAIGLERGVRNHPAGFRTHILVCVGACLAILTSEFVFDTIGSATDPTRIGAQVISGIGFLGVGTIFMAGRNTVKGLTTAAGLWASGAIGLAVGIGFYSGAVITTVVVLAVLGVFPVIEGAIFRSSRRLILNIEVLSIESEMNFYQHLINSGCIVKNKHITSVSGTADKVTAHYMIQMKAGIKADELIRELAVLPGVLLLEVQ